MTTLKICDKLKELRKLCCIFAAVYQRCAIAVYISLFLVPFPSQVLYCRHGFVNNSSFNVLSFLRFSQRTHRAPAFRNNELSVCMHECALFQLSIFVFVSDLVFCAIPVCVIKKTSKLLKTDFGSHRAIFNKVLQLKQYTIYSIRLRRPQAQISLIKPKTIDSRTFSTFHF